MEKMVTLSQLRGMGFSAALIAELLPEPITRPNPHYRHAAPMRLWTQADVDAAIDTPDFAAAQARREKRSAAARKAADTKRAKTIEAYAHAAEAAEIRVIPLAELEQATLEAKQQWYDRNQYGDDPRDAYGADAATLKRWMVNYVRHKLIIGGDYNTPIYDFDCSCLDGRTGRDTAYTAYHNAILRKIAAAYPALAAECNRQMI